MQFVQYCINIMFWPFAELSLQWHGLVMISIKGSLTSFSSYFWTREIIEYSIISLVQKEKDVNEPLSMLTWLILFSNLFLLALSFGIRAHIFFKHAKLHS